jgi:hypothetical protein
VLLNLGQLLNGIGSDPNTNKCGFPGVTATKTNSAVLAVLAGASRFPEIGNPI